MSNVTTSTETPRSLALCVAEIVGTAPGEVPHDRSEIAAWLASRGLGLVPIDNASAFSWAGPWIAMRPSKSGAGEEASVMFGAPSGSIFEPVATEDEILSGVMVVPLDIARWPVPEMPTRADGATIESIVIASDAEGVTRHVSSAEALVGRGLRGDRYELARGTFPSGRTGSAITLIEAEVIDELAGDRDAEIDHRRNVVTRGVDLNSLVGRRFRLGSEVLCEGSRLCEPCAHLDRLNGGGLLKPLVHRGGLRADILSGGTIRVGDALQVVVVR